MELLENIGRAVEAGEEEEVEELVQKALEEHHRTLDIIDNGLMKGMGVVGEKFGAGEMFIPEVMISAQALQKGMEILQPYLVEGERNYTGKVVIGTVEGDIHDLGKNLVKMMLTANGFSVKDVGIDVPAEKFVEAVQEHQPHILGLSALLTTTMPEMGKVIQALQENGLRERVKVILGGAPVNQDFAEEIGADLYAEDAIRAATLLKEELS